MNPISTASYEPLLSRGWQYNDSPTWMESLTPSFRICTLRVTQTSELPQRKQLLGMTHQTRSKVGFAIRDDNVLIDSRHINIALDSSYLAIVACHHKFPHSRLNELFGQCRYLINCDCGINRYIHHIGAESLFAYHPRNGAT